MLNRQKALLLILQQVGGTASKLQIVKWAFLLSQETPSQGGNAFYKFIPYRYGPYSFTLIQEIDSLARNGFLEMKKNSCELTPLGKNLNVSLSKKILQDINFVSERYGDLSAQELIDFVYCKYSWFTINSDFINQRREGRPVGEIAIYTAGYEGKTVDEFLNLLLKSGISCLIDVRYNPVSRRYGFHKSTLERLCGFLEVDYQHIPELGIPGSERQHLDSATQYESLFESYHRRLSRSEPFLDNVIKLIQSQPSVLVCMEANPACCHRNVLANHIKNSTMLPIEHLRY